MYFIARRSKYERTFFLIKKKMLCIFMSLAHPALKAQNPFGCSEKLGFVDLHRILLDAWNRVHLNQ